MLHEFIASNRDTIIARCRAKIASRPAPRPTDFELEHGVPLFLDQLTDSLRHAMSPNVAISKSARKHADELLRSGFTIAQVVHDYGNICQAITELATQTAAPIATNEFRVLNLCLDEAIASAVTEYNKLREDEGTERLGRLAHELRNLLNGARLAFEILKTGSVGLGGSTGAVLGRSLARLQSLVDRQLAEVRLQVGSQYWQTIVICEFIEDVEAAAAMDANARGLQFSVRSVGREVTVQGDGQLLASVVGNLLQNAFKYTRPGGHVRLSVRTTDAQVFIDVEDQCGGLPPGKAEELFRPFAQRSGDRSGLGLGLAICERGAQANRGTLHVLNHPGEGCVFTLELPRQPPAG
jgi:signal transduction histidine kinase